MSLPVRSLAALGMTVLAVIASAARGTRHCERREKNSSLRTPREELVIANARRACGNLDDGHMSLPVRSLAALGMTTANSG